MIRIEKEKPALYQWDLNQRLVLTSINLISIGIEVHFSTTNDSKECCVIAPSYEEGGEIFVDIPNKLLQAKGIISVYLYVQEENKAWTEYSTEILVLPRPKPANYVYTETETEVLCWKDLENQLNVLNETTVKITPQELTASQRTQARANIAASDSEEIEMLIEADLLPAIHDKSGKIFTDENGKIILRY